MKYVGLLFILLILPYTHAASPKKCELDAAAEKKLLALPYAAFDQSFSRGWRPLANDDCYDLCARLIERYRQQNHSSLKSWQEKTLHWHAGQMLAYAGQNSSAIAQMKLALNPKESIATPFQWNAYVRATIAFLEGKSKKLQQQRQRVASSHKIKGKVPNLAVVDNLIRCQQYPYKVAYAGCPQETKKDQVSTQLAAPRKKQINSD